MNVIENKNVSLENISPEQEADNIFNSAVDIYSELTEAYKGKPEQLNRIYKKFDEIEEIYDNLKVLSREKTPDDLFYLKQEFQDLKKLQKKWFTIRDLKILSEKKVLNEAGEEFNSAINIYSKLLDSYKGNSKQINKIYKEFDEIEKAYNNFLKLSKEKTSENLFYLRQEIQDLKKLQETGLTREDLEVFSGNKEFNDLNKLFDEESKALKQEIYNKLTSSPAKRHLLTSLISQISAALKDKRFYKTDENSWRFNYTIFKNFKNIIKNKTGDEALDYLLKQKKDNLDYTEQKVLDFIKQEEQQENSSFFDSFGSSPESRWQEFALQNNILADTRTDNEIILDRLDEMFSFSETMGNLEANLSNAGENIQEFITDSIDGVSSLAEDTVEFVENLPEEVSEIVSSVKESVNKALESKNPLEYVAEGAKDLLDKAVDEIVSAPIIQKSLSFVKEKIHEAEAIIGTDEHYERFENKIKNSKSLSIFDGEELGDYMIWLYENSKDSDDFLNKLQSVLGPQNPGDYNKFIDLFTNWKEGVDDCQLYLQEKGLPIIIKLILDDKESLLPKIEENTFFSNLSNSLQELALNTNEIKYTKKDEDKNKSEKQKKEEEKSKKESQKRDGERMTKFTINGKTVTEENFTIEDAKNKTDNFGMKWKELDNGEIKLNIISTGKTETFKSKADALSYLALVDIFEECRLSPFIPFLSTIGTMTDLKTDINLSDGVKPAEAKKLIRIILMMLNMEEEISISKDFGQLTRFFKGRFKTKEQTILQGQKSGIIREDGMINENIIAQWLEESKNRKDITDMTNTFSVGGELG
ncbi:MAG: hypothetical protein N4A38_04495 [Candidatus Gracilibacteria bacterium]|nr:hypothetical protein [Candidatus Gracilibacteria bacterium]